MHGLLLSLCCVRLNANYLYLHCAVSVIGLVAVDSTHNKEFNYYYYYEPIHCDNII
jgi:hypothetical protein